MDTVLVLNAGSSSLKASLLCPHFPAEMAANRSTQEALSSATTSRVLTAHAERLQTELSLLHITLSTVAAKRVLATQSEGSSENTNNQKKLPGALRLTSRSSSINSADADDNEEGEPDGRGNKPKFHEFRKPMMTHEEVIEELIRFIREYDEALIKTIAVVGHRVVHGGTLFTDSVLVDDSVMEGIERVSHLAPLHNPANLAGIRMSQRVFSAIPNVAVFDTSFHTSSMPSVAYTYPLPLEYRQDPLGIRKYGFHGTSVRYVSKKASDILTTLGVKQSHKMVVCHLGNGASLTAVVGGKSVDTTMEFTPLTGLMMGTRSGSVDPSIVPYAAARLGKTAQEVVTDLNKNSGLKAISRGDSDMRSVLERRSEDNDAKLAVDMFVYLLAKQMASMIVACGGSVDAIVFTAGIGEHCSEIRRRSLERLGAIVQNVPLDDARNASHGKDSNGIISDSHNNNNNNTEGSSPVVLVIPTDEEAMICQDCIRIALG